MNERDWQPVFTEEQSAGFYRRQFDMAMEATLNLAARVKRLEDAMKNVCDELEEDFDTVDGGDGQPAPNKAMRLASELKEAIYGPGGSE